VLLQSPRSELFEDSTEFIEGPWRLHYHGTAGFTIEAAQTTIVLDPFVSRPGLLKTALFKLKPNTSAIEAAFPRADAVLVGHAHHDHILDAPHVCKTTGALFISAEDGCNVARAGGVPERQIRSTMGREDIQVGAATIRGIPSKHGRVYFGRVTLPGEITEPPPWPARFFHLPHGRVLNWHIDLGGLRVVHIDSAEVVDAELKGMSADIVCLCAIGRRYRPDYVQTVVKHLQPRWIVPCHWDWFFTPPGAPAKLLPGVDFEGFLEEIKQAGVAPLPIRIGESIRMHPPEPDR